MPNPFRSRFSGMFIGKTDRRTARERVEQALAESNPALAAREFKHDRERREDEAENRAREGQLIPPDPDERGRRDRG